MNISPDRVNVFMLGLKALRLELLDKDDQISGRATGFVIQDADGIFLYTCWHVVTGIDFLDPRPEALPDRKFIVAYTKNIEDRQTGVIVVGGTQSIRIPLYDSDSKPRWQQDPNEREQHDLNEIGIQVPRIFDVVRIPIDLSAKSMEFLSFTKNDGLGRTWEVGTDVIIIGYPHGYSAMDEDSPEPIFLKRSIATNQTKSVGRVLLDGTGTPGMSGAPILAKHESQWLLAGVYTGILFPDFQLRKKGGNNDRFAALGMMAPIHVARAFMQVPRLYD